MQRVPYEENGVRVVMANYGGPIVVSAARMSIEEARAFIACVERAIWCYCGELEKNGYKAAAR